MKQCNHAGKLEKHGLIRITIEVKKTQTVSIQQQFKKVGIIANVTPLYIKPQANESTISERLGQSCKQIQHQITNNQDNTRRLSSSF